MRLGTVQITTRWQAFFTHLAISVLVVGTIALVISLVWFPIEWRAVTGVGRLLAIFASVDVVAGPLLTLIVFKPGKKSLAMDLSIIALAQTSLLIYGLTAMWQARPVYLVAVEDRFEWVTAADLAPEDIAKATPEYATLSWFRPRVVGALLPLDAKLRENLLFESLAGRDIQLQPRYYTKLDQVLPTLAMHGTSASILMKSLDTDQTSRLQAAVGDSNPDEVTALPLSSRHGSAIILLDSKTGNPVGGLDIDPWSLHWQR